MQHTDRAFKVLVVDDSSFMRKKLVKATEALGHSTEAASNGQEALTKLSKSGFDLVLLDIEMPLINGLKVLATIRSTNTLSDIPVIVISAVEEMDYIVQAIELGADDFLPKNFEKVIFVARVKACLTRKSMADQRAEHVQQIQAEKDKVDGLLRATLPTAAIHELKTTNRVQPRRFEDVAVLFADVVSFTHFCDNNPPEEAVLRLQHLVTGFEKICQEEGLEKIKTIGDAFMATAGLLNDCHHPTEAATRCALRMVEAAPELAKGWQVKVGIHTGPVVAGVIGQQQHLYDLWGDTVNTASRISDVAAPASVCASVSVWDSLTARGKTTRGSCLGEISVKGKRKFVMYRIDSLV